MDLYEEKIQTFWKCMVCVGKERSGGEEEIPDEMLNM
jgi:hypothetical protein